MPRKVESNCDTYPGRQEGKRTEAGGEDERIVRFRRDKPTEVTKGTMFLSKVKKQNWVWGLEERKEEAEK